MSHPLVVRSMCADIPTDRLPTFTHLCACPHMGYTYPDLKSATPCVNVQDRFMAYTEKAKALRRCTGTRKDGQPCSAWALWDDPRQSCVQHAGRGNRGPHQYPPAWTAPGYGRTRNPNCTCAAYQWPHKPGGGLCRWPDPPEMICTTPASTHFVRGQYGPMFRFLSVRRGNGSGRESGRFVCCCMCGSGDSNNHTITGTINQH